MSVSTAALVVAPAQVRTVGATEDPRALRAQPSLSSFAVLLGQLILALVVVTIFRLEEFSFLLLSVVAVAGFAVHYWLPFRQKRRFLVALSVGASYLLLGPVVATIVLGCGLAGYYLLVGGLAYWQKVAVVVAVFALATYLRTLAPESTVIPDALWPILGSIFLFRIIILLYDARHTTTRLTFGEYAAYLLMIPNFYFALFPVVDFQTMRQSYYRRDINLVAQQGVEWIARGIIQLLCYRLVYNYRGVWSVDYIQSFPSLIREMMLIYLLYLHVSASFHISIGMMHLFGYDLPETHRRYLLASSFTDFWRRINIYWKDFMVKLVYFPVYFRLRKRGDTQAQVIATALVFVATWFLHAYQFFWISGQFLFTGPDIAFWSAFGVLVVGNVLIEQRRKGHKPPTGWVALPLRAIQIAVMLLVVTSLWSLWNSTSIREWFDIMTWWTRRSA